MLCRARSLRLWPGTHVLPSAPQHPCQFTPRRHINRFLLEPSECVSIPAHEWTNDWLPDAEELHETTHDRLPNVEEFHGTVDRLHTTPAQRIQAILPPDDRRAVHARTVLRLREKHPDGRALLRAGVLGGFVDDQARVTSHADGSLVLVLDEKEPSSESGDYPTPQQPPSSPPSSSSPPHNGSRPKVDMLVALPSPRALARVVEQATTQGVGRVILCGTARSEKQLWGATWLAKAKPLWSQGTPQNLDDADSNHPATAVTPRHPGRSSPVSRQVPGTGNVLDESRDLAGIPELRHFLVSGLELAGNDTVVPRVYAARALWPVLRALQAETETEGEEKTESGTSTRTRTLRLFAHPCVEARRIAPTIEAFFAGPSSSSSSSPSSSSSSSSSSSVTSAPSPASPEESRVLIALGPPGGWVIDEVEAFQVAGFIPVSLGDRILRTDTATVVALGLVHDALTAST